VPFVHALSSRDHTRRRLVLLGGALLLPRVVTLAVGCGPRAGDEGGPCIASDSCSRDPYCNGNLECRGDTCVQGGPQPPASPAPVDPCTALLSRSRCAAGSAARCRQTTTPDPAWNGACAATLSDDDGDTVFCCDTSRPMCWAPYGEATLAPGPSFMNESWSNCPGGPFSCHDLSAPPLDASIQCAQDLPDDAGWASVCCVSGSACFELTPQSPYSPPGYFPQGACATGEHEYFCTGTASLASGACRALGDAAAAPPTQAAAYCCPATSAPTVSYGDAGTDS